MTERVILILSNVSASLIETVLQARIDTIDDTECNNVEISVRLAIERARLSTAVGQLKAPT